MNKYELHSSEREELYQLYLYAFNRTDSDERRKFFMDRVEYGKVLRIKDQQKIVSALYRLPLNLNLRGVQFKMGGIGDVMTYPEAGGHGYATKLLTEILHNMYDEGYELSFLAPFAHRYYRRLGYEQVSNKFTYQIETDKVRPFKVQQGNVTRETLTDGLDKIKKYYVVRSGKIERPAWWWHYLTLKNNWEIAFAYDDSQNFSGYIIYERISEQMIIHEFDFQTFQAYQQLLDFVFAHASMFKQFIFEDYGNQYRGNYASEPGLMQVKIEPYMMGRIVNFEKFITKYPFANDFGTLQLKVEDDNLAVNNRVFGLSQHASKPLKNGLWQLKGKINDLSAIFLGALSLEDAIRMNRLRVSDVTMNQLQEFSRALIHHAPSFSDYF